MGIKELTDEQLREELKKIISQAKHFLLKYRTGKITVEACQEGIKPLYKPANELLAEKTNRMNREFKQHRSAPKVRVMGDFDRFRFI